jgi:hypothetical protein
MAFRNKSIDFAIFDRQNKKSPLCKNQGSYDKKKKAY